MWADPDGDGRVNLLEYALGGNPLAVHSPGIDPVVTTDEEDPDMRIMFTHRRIVGGTGNAVDGYSVDDLFYLIEVSPSLESGSWQTGTEWLEEIGDPVDNGDGTESVTISINDPEGVGDKQFVRLRVHATGD